MTYSEDSANQKIGGEFRDLNHSADFELNSVKGLKMFCLNIDRLLSKIDQLRVFLSRT